jgi:hypothetical protein
MKHPWQARLGIAIIMLVLAFLGMVTTDVHSTGGWDYWRWVVPVYAVMALWLSWYVKRKTKTISPITLWHELLHWIGLILAVFLVSCFVNLGTVSRFNAGLFDLTLLSLGVFLAGVYIETTFLFIGIVLGIFAFLSAFVAQYLYAFLIPILVAGLLIIGVTIWFSHRKFKSQ